MVPYTQLASVNWQLWFLPLGCSEAGKGLPRGGQTHPVKTFLSVDLPSMAYLVVSFSSHHDPNSFCLYRSFRSFKLSVASTRPKNSSLCFSGISGVEFGKKRWQTIAFTTSSEARARLNFSGSLFFFLVHFYQFSLEGVKKMYRISILFLNSCYFFKNFRKIAHGMGWGLELWLRLVVMLHISLNHYLEFKSLDEYPEMRMVKVRNRMMLETE